MGRIVAALAVAGVLVAQPAWSAARGDAIAAEALFREGTKLAKADRCEEAIPKLLESHRLDPTPGTLLNVARCERRLRRLASAWQHAQDAATLARHEHKEDRAKAAQVLVDELEAVLPRIRIELSGNVPQGLELVRDDTVLSVAAAGTAIPADPGTHTVRATAPQCKPQEQRFEVREGQGVVVIKLRAFEKVEAPVVAAPPKPAAVAPPKVPESALPTRGNRGLWLGGLIGGGAAGATGTVLGVVVLSGTSNLKSECGGNVCTPAQQSRLDNLKTLSTVATVAFVAAGVGLGLAVVFWPSKTPIEARAGVGSIELTGRF